MAGRKAPGSAAIGVAARPVVRKCWRMAEADEAHVVEIVQRERRAKGDDAAYWRCSCGQSAGGRWYGSTQEAAKAAERHLHRACS
jgi:hypothetical protein